MRRSPALPRALVAVALALAAAPPSAPAAVRACGTDGRAEPRAVGIRARGVGCVTARQVARRWFLVAYQGDARRRVYDGAERRWICGVRAPGGRAVACRHARSLVTFRLRR